MRKYWPIIFLLLCAQELVASNPAWKRVGPIYVLEAATAGGLAFALGFMDWPKISLGAAMTMLAIFFPSITTDHASGSVLFRVKGVNVSLKGSLRTAAALGGIALIILGAFETSSRIDRYSQRAAKVNALIAPLSGTLSSMDSNAGQARSFEGFSNQAPQKSKTPKMTREEIERHLSRIDAALVEMEELRKLHEADSSREAFEQLTATRRRLLQQARDS